MEILLAEACSGWHVLMRSLGLDISKHSTGWACWGPDDEKLAFGWWRLGSEFTSRGAVFANLHARMSEVQDTYGQIDAVFFEEAIDVRALSGHTNIDTIKVLGGLNAHAESWGCAMGCRIVQGVNQSRWRRDFIGPIRRGTKRATLKEMAMARCRQLGFRTYVDDEADAIGILTYGLLSIQITPYWIADEVLRAEL